MSDEKKVPWGPNVRKLICHKMSVDAIPSGGGIAAGIKFLSDKDRIVKSARESEEWVKSAILAVRQAVGPNPYREVSDEEIARRLLKKIEKRKVGQSK